jgi:hypothetical protein
MKDAQGKPDPEAATGEPPPNPLRVVVEAEARRVLSDSQMAADPERLAQGWERRFIADDARMAEMVRLYQELGYETAVDPIRPGDVGEECGECQLVAQRRLKMIYTRPGPQREPSGER